MAAGSTRKKATKRRAPQARRGAAAGRSAPALPGWLWLLVGLALGVGLAFAMAHLGFAPKVPTDARPQPQATPPSSEEIASEAEEAEPERKPRYDFYTVLPEMEVVVPEAEIAEREAAREAQMEQRGGYLLQAGSFQSAEDADTLRAQLTLLGLEAHVQTVTVNDAMWHRVRLGPFASVRDLEKAKRRVEGEGLRPIVLRER